MTQRTGASPMPPATKTMSLPRHSSSGKQLPYGPRKPTVSPTLTSRSAVVTLPTSLKVHSMASVRVGGLAMQKVASPAPKTEYSPNWPARNSNERAERLVLELQAQRARVGGLVDDVDARS